MTKTEISPVELPNQRPWLARTQRPTCSQLRTGPRKSLSPSSGEPITVVYVPESLPASQTKYTAERVTRDQTSALLGYHLLLA